MALFPESATLGWVFGLGIAALVIGCMVVALIARYWPRKEEQPSPRLPRQTGKRSHECDHRFG
jgi:hypothetical protein